MKLSQFKTLIREEVRKATTTKTRRVVENRTTLSEALSETYVLGKLSKIIAVQLKKLGLKKKMSPEDLKIIALQWIMRSLNEVEDSLEDDIFEDSIMIKVIKKYDPNFDGTFDDDDDDDY
jgi:hypothetical protein